MTIGDRIRAQRERAQMTLEEVAGRVQVSRQTLSRYETGVIQAIPSDKIELIAQALGTTPAYLMGWDGAGRLPVNALPVEETRRLPILGEAACGRPMLALEEAEAYAEVPVDLRADFSLRCRGESMIGIQIIDGDLVHIRSQADVENGQVAAVEVDGVFGREVMLKRVRKVFSRGGRLAAIELHAENPLHEVMRFDGEEMKAVHIRGLLVGVTREVRQ